MRQINRWLAILLVASASFLVFAPHGGDAGAQVRNAGPDRVAGDDSAGSAMARVRGGDERHSWPQRAILVLLLTLVAVTVVFGIGTIAYAFRDRWERRREP